MLGTIRTIVLPLARPGVIASMTLLLRAGDPRTGSSLFLYTSNTMVMSVAAARLLRRRKSRQDRCLQSGADGFARGPDRRRELAVEGGSPGQRCPRRIKQNQGRIGHEQQDCRQDSRQDGHHGRRRRSWRRVERTPALAQQEFGSPELIAAAKAEGKLVYYTANFAEVEQQVIKAFNKRFSGDQDRDGARPRVASLSPREDRGRGRKLIADVVDHSDAR